MGKLEDFFVVKEYPAPIVIYDHMVHAHHVFEWVKDFKAYVSTNKYHQLIKAAWAYSLNRGPEFLPQVNWRVIVVRDHKDHEGAYWRKNVGECDPVLQQAWDNFQGEIISRKYKGQRGKRPDEFWEVENIGRAYQDAYFPVFSEEKFEADDWAGLAHRLHPNNRQMFLYTVDRDWSMLVDEDREIYFANSRRPRERERIQQRLVDNEAVKDHTLHYMKREISHPRELAYAKSEKGDMGDNLPPGAPVYLFDLCEPPAMWRLENYNSQKAELFKKELENEKGNININHLEEVERVFPEFLEGVRFK